MPSARDGLVVYDKLGLGMRKRSTKFASPDFQFASTVLEMKDTLVTSAQILALFTTPITLAAAPGAGRLLLFESALVFLDYGGTAYTIGTAGNIQVKYQNAAGPVASSVIVPAGFADQTQDEYRSLYPAAALTVDVTDFLNQPLVLHQLTANMTLGNSPFKVRTFYREVDLLSLEDII